METIQVSGEFSKRAERQQARQSRILTLAIGGLCCTAVGLFVGLAIGTMRTPSVAAAIAQRDRVQSQLASVEAELATRPARRVSPATDQQTASGEDWAFLTPFKKRFGPGSDGFAILDGLQCSGLWKPTDYWEITKPSSVMTDAHIRLFPNDRQMLMEGTIATMDGCRPVVTLLFRADMVKDFSTAWKQRDDHMLAVGLAMGFNADEMRRLERIGRAVPVCYPEQDAQAVQLVLDRVPPATREQFEKAMVAPTNGDIQRPAIGFPLSDRHVADLIFRRVGDSMIDQDGFWWSIVLHEAFLVDYTATKPSNEKWPRLTLDQVDAL